MKNNNINVNPIGLKGSEVNARMKELMGISTINENKTNSKVELTKIGPDGKSYAIIRENHKYFIKSSEKTKGLIAEDFSYIGGLKNKTSEAYDSYASAIKHLNINFKSLADAHGQGGDINVFKNDNLINESGVAGFSNHSGNGFSGAGNMEGNTPLYEDTEEVTEGYDDEPYYDDVKGKKSDRWDSDDADDKESDDADDMSEAELAVDAILQETEGKRLSIRFAMENMDAIIESIDVKKKD